MQTQKISSMEGNDGLLSYINLKNKFLKIRIFMLTQKQTATYLAFKHDPPLVHDEISIPE